MVPTTRKNKSFSKKCLKDAKDLTLDLAFHFAKAKHSKKEPIAPDLQVKSLIKANLTGIEALFASFTTDRGGVHRYLQDPSRAVVAYLLSFHLPNLVRMWGVWDRVEQRGLPFAGVGRRVKLVDIGCGSGAMSQASAFYLRSRFKDIPLSWLGFDRQGRFLDAFRRGAEHFSPKEAIQAAKLDLVDLDIKKLQPADDELLVVHFGYVLNEINNLPRVARKVEQIFSYLSSLGSQVLVVGLEPGNQHPARSLMQWRDQWAQTGEVLYPCGFSGSCPMLQRERDWCFSEWSWTRPGYIAYIDQLLGTNREKLNGAGFMWSNKPRGPEVSVVVGRPRNRFGDFEYLICESSGLRKKKGRDPILARGEVVPAPFLADQKPEEKGLSKSPRRSGRRGQTSGFSRAKGGG